MHLEFLVEEPSAETALLTLVPKIVGIEISFNIHVFQGKMDLIKKLPNRLRGYKPWLPQDWRIIVLVDRDNDDCLALKANLENIARQEGLLSKTMTPPCQHFQILNRIAVAELESWFFGDTVALQKAYPRLSANLSKKKKLRDPDAINDTWETLEKILQQVGYYPGGLLKKEAARKISQFMDPNRNISTSFRKFVCGLRRLKVCQ